MVQAHLRACLNPLQRKSTETNRTGIILATRVDTDWLLKYIFFHVAGEKQFSRKRESLTPFVLGLAPEQAQKRLISWIWNITLDGGAHQLRTKTLLLCRGMCKRSPSVLIRLARTSLLHGPKHGFLPSNGTNVP